MNGKADLSIDSQRDRGSQDSMCMSSSIFSDSHYKNDNLIIELKPIDILYTTSILYPSYHQMPLYELFKLTYKDVLSGSFDAVELGIVVFNSR